METHERKFTGVFIPAWVIDLRLPLQAEKLYSIILSLQGADGCYASTRYLGDQLNVNERQAREWLRLLREAELIYTVRVDGRRRWIKARLDTPAVPPPGRPAENCRADRQETAGQPGDISPTDIIDDSKGNKSEGKTLHALARDIFLYQYREWVGQDFPYWDGKAAGGLSALLKQLRAYVQKHRVAMKPDAPALTDAELLDQLDGFLVKVGLLTEEDGFILDNFNPNYLSGSFNKLVTTLTNRANGTEQRYRQARDRQRAHDRQQGWADLLRAARGL